MEHLRWPQCEGLEDLCVCLSLLKGEFHYHWWNLLGQRTSCLRQLSPAISGEAPSLSASRATGQLTQTDLPFGAPHLGPRRKGGSGERGREATQKENGKGFCMGNNCSSCTAAVFRKRQAIYIRVLQPPEKCLPNACHLRFFQSSTAFGSSPQGCLALAPHWLTLLPSGVRMNSEGWISQQQNWSNLTDCFCSFDGVAHSCPVAQAKASTALCCWAGRFQVILGNG